MRHRSGPGGPPVSQKHEVQVRYWRSIPLLVWGLLLRLLAAVQVIALLSIRSQLLALAGARGATPVASTLRQVARDFGSWRERLLRFPTLLWLGASDTALLRLSIA